MIDSDELSGECDREAVSLTRIIEGLEFSGCDSAATGSCCSESSFSVTSGVSVSSEKNGFNKGTSEVGSGSAKTKLLKSITILYLGNTF